MGPLISARYFRILDELDSRTNGEAWGRELSPLFAPDFHSSVNQVMRPGWVTSQFVPGERGRGKLYELTWFGALALEYGRAEREGGPANPGAA